MSDRELLEAAAKAAGETVVRHAEPGDSFTGLLIDGYEGAPSESWNPLNDDGDALRLAVKLGLVVDVRYSKMRGMGGYNRVDFWPPGKEGSAAQFIACHDHDGDHYAATRRAIVRAAAEIGKESP